MAEVDANDLFATYEASIPALPVGNKVHYFVSAEANSEIRIRPMPAPEGWWSYKVVRASLGLDEANATSPWRALYPNRQGDDMPGTQHAQAHSVPSDLAQRQGNKFACSTTECCPKEPNAFFSMPAPWHRGLIVTLTTVHGTRWTERLMVRE